jgi:Tfp pilus assembly PilM family ATPase
VYECGLIPAGFDSTFFNLMNLYHDYLVKKENEKKNICIIYHGHQSTTVSFFKGGILKATRIIQLGGIHFTNLLKEKDGISFEDAEKLKKGSEIFVKDNPDLQNKNELYNAIKPAFGDLVKNVYNSIDQYLARFREFKINEIILSGGGGAFRNIETSLNSNLNTKTIIGTEIAPIIYKNEKLTIEDALVLNCAIGSLMRGE